MKGVRTGRGNWPDVLSQVFSGDPRKRKAAPGHECRSCRHGRRGVVRSGIDCRRGHYPVDWLDGCADWEERQWLSPGRTSRAAVTAAPQAPR